MKEVLLLMSLITIGFGGRITTQGEPYFACSSKYLFAFGENGDLKWKAPVEHKAVIDRVTKDMVILRSSLKERRGIEYAAYNPANGDLIWKTAIPYHDSIYVGYGETLCVISSDLGNYLLNLRTGELKIGEPPKGWESHGYSKVGPASEAPVDTSKIAKHKESEEVIVSWSSKFIFGFDPEGNVKWKVKRPDKKRSGGYIRHDNICAFSSGKHLIVFSTLNGKVKWKRSLSVEIRGCGISYPEVIIYLANGEKLTFNIETGKLLKKEKGTLEIKPPMK